MAQPKKEKEKSERGDKEDSGEVFPEDGKHSVTSSIPAATSLGAEAAGREHSGLPQARSQSGPCSGCLGLVFSSFDKMLGHRNDCREKRKCIIFADP